MQNKWLHDIIARIMLYEAIRDHLFAIMTYLWEKHDNRVLSGQKFPENIVELPDIPYIPGGHKDHVLDVYYPAGIQGPFPAIINIHGGGFIYGDKWLNKIFCFNLAKKGFLIYNLNYRLAKNEVKVPDQIRDIIYAMDWIGNNIDSFSFDKSDTCSIDKNKIYLSGESAGAYLAVMAVLISKSPRLQELFNINKMSISIKALATISGFFEWPYRTMYAGLRSIILDKGFKKQQYYKDLIFKNIPEIEDLPPIFLTTNGNDMLKNMTFNFVELLKKNNLEHRFAYLEKRKKRKFGHVFNVFYLDWEESKMLNNGMLEFLSRY